MRDLSWKPLATVTVTARPDVLWECACSYLEGPLNVRIKAKGEWQVCPKTRCGPDGALTEGLEDDTLLKNAPIGALIAKIGGSTAEKPLETGATAFAVGSFCVMHLAPEARGALYFAMNDKVKAFDAHDGALDVEIEIAR